MFVSWYLVVSGLRFLVLSTFKPPASISSCFLACGAGKWRQTFHSGIWDILLTLPFLKLLGLIRSSCRNPKSEVFSSNHQPFHSSFKCSLLETFLPTEHPDLGRFSSMNYFREGFLPFPTCRWFSVLDFIWETLLLPTYSLSNDVVLITA